MELLLKLLAQQADSLTPGNLVFLVMMALILAFFTTQFLLKMTRHNKTGVLGKIFGLTEEAVQLSELRANLKNLNDSSIDSSAKIITTLGTMQDDGRTSGAGIASNTSSIQLVRQEMANFAADIRRDLEDVKHMIKLADNREMLQQDAIKELILRNSELLSRIGVEIQKVDEFSRAAAPEFRSYHKELSKDLSDLSRDVALVERSLQTQINTVNAVKLR